MKKLFTLLLASAVCGAIYAQPTMTKVADVKTEDALFIKQTEHDFGKIPQGKPVNYIFAVTNNSKDSLKISNVQASCGCTTPEWEQNKTIAPGGSTKITVGYNAAAEGPFNKTITVSYNNNMSKLLYIKGEVWKTPAESAPANKTLDDLKN